MTDEQSLLATILNNPDDDTPRLVFADWLDENGQEERAELIRVQIELARYPTASLRSREWELLVSHGHEWKEQAGVPNEATVEFRRGFIEFATFSACNDWLAFHAGILENNPICDFLIIDFMRGALRIEIKTLGLNMWFMTAHDSTSSGGQWLRWSPMNMMANSRPALVAGLRNWLVKEMGLVNDLPIWAAASTRTVAAESHAPV